MDNKYTGVSLKVYYDKPDGTSHYYDVDLEDACRWAIGKDSFWELEEFFENLIKTLPK